MGNAAGVLPDGLEDLCKSEEMAEEIMEPLTREGLICEVSEGLMTVFYRQTLEILGVASVATIRYIATNEESGEEVFDDYEGEFNETGAYDLFEEFSY